MLSCKLSNCDRPVVARDLCRPHYARWWKYGDTAVRPLRLPTAERFWAKVRKTDACWLWTGTINSDGYGHIRFNGKVVLATRFSYFLTHNKWPQPLCLHTCDNPTCVRPDHLYEGSHQDNMDDMVRRGRARTHTLYGSQAPGAKLNENEVDQIRVLLSKNTAVKTIANTFGICKQTVYNIKSGRFWSRH